MRSKYKYPPLGYDKRSEIQSYISNLRDEEKIDMDFLARNLELPHDVFDKLITYMKIRGEIVITNKERKQIEMDDMNLAAHRNICPSYIDDEIECVWCTPLSELPAEYIGEDEYEP